ncbi:hypothetical protein NL676_008726 [Syzygium grande]|nr:hypothetical protein NL676_008726 [Syzygium grande]
MGRTPSSDLELIVRQLATEDFLAVRRSCTSWWTATTKEKFNAKSKAPWLTIYLVYTRIDSGVRGLSKYRIVNPLSGVSIELHALEMLHRDIPRIHKITLSSSASLSRSYAVMISYDISPGFAFLRSGDDAWTWSSTPSLAFPGSSQTASYPDYEDDQMKSYSMEEGKFETYIDATSSCLFDATSNCLCYDATSRRRICEAKWFQPDV